MKLLLVLLLISLVGLAVGKAIESSAGELVDIGKQQPVYQEPEEEAAPGNAKRIAKRSYGLSSLLLPSYGHELYLGHGLGHELGLGHGLGYSYGWPSYGYGVSLGWPSISIGHGYSSYGSHGWHSKW